MRSKAICEADALLSCARWLLSDHRTRAKKKGAVLDFGLGDVRQMLAEHSLCEYCQMPLFFAVSLDHRTPIGRGGKHALDDLAVCCARCNGIKGILTEGELRELLTLLA